MLHEVIEDVAARYGFRCHRQENGAVVGAECSSLSLRLFWEPGSATVFAAFYCRSTSWNWPGERTDLHDFYSTFLQAALWRLGLTAARTVQVPHPVVYIPGEIYGRYVVPVQPQGMIVGDDVRGYADLRMLVVGLYLTEIHLHNIIGCEVPDEHANALRDTSWDQPELAVWADNVTRELFDDTTPGDDCSYNERKSPDWWYYRSQRNGAAVFKSPTIVPLLVEQLTFPNSMRLPGATGALVGYEGFRCYISRRLEARAGRILKRLEGTSRQPSVVMPLEDCLLVLGRQHLLLLPCEGGRSQYLREKERTKQIGRQRSDQLFGPDQFEWIEPLDAGRFEGLAYDLLLRETGVDRSRVRSAGPTNERDGGRDLLVEWLRPAVGMAPHPDDGPPILRRQFIVQCKAKMKNVGVGDVGDILSTMYFHRADGYLLVVSRQVTNGLVNRLEDMRRRGDYDAEWWTRAELEERLRDHPDLVARYADLIKRVE